MGAAQPTAQLQPGDEVRWLDARAPAPGEGVLVLDRGEVLDVDGGRVCVRWRGAGVSWVALEHPRLWWAV